MINAQHFAPGVNPSTWSGGLMLSTYAEYSSGIFPPCLKAGLVMFIAAPFVFLERATFGAMTHSSRWNSNTPDCGMQVRSKVSSLLVNRRENVRFRLHLLQCFDEGERLRFFTVNDSDLFDIARNRRHVALQFGPVSMPGKRVQ